MTIIAITISAVVCGWSILLVMSDERQRALMNAQLSNMHAAPHSAAAHNVPAKADLATTTESGKRKN